MRLLLARLSRSSQKQALRTGLDVRPGNSARLTRLARFLFLNLSRSVQERLLLLQTLLTLESPTLKLFLKADLDPVQTSKLTP